MANAGIGSASHLSGMLLMSQLQVTLTTVPYRGTGPVMNDLLGKQVDMTCDQASNTTGLILSKQVKASPSPQIAPAFAARSSHRRRSRSQRLRARGLAWRVRAAWHAPAIVEKLSMALIGALNDPDLVKRFREISTEPMPADRATPTAAQRTLTARSTVGRRLSRRPANTRISHTCPDAA